MASRAARKRRYPSEQQDVGAAVGSGTGHGLQGEKTKLLKQFLGHEPLLPISSRKQDLQDHFLNFCFQYNKLDTNQKISDTEGKRLLDSLRADELDSIDNFLRQFRRLHYGKTEEHKRLCIAAYNKSDEMDYRWLTRQKGFERLAEDIDATDVKGAYRKALRDAYVRFLRRHHKFDAPALSDNESDTARIIKILYDGELLSFFSEFEAVVNATCKVKTHGYTPPGCDGLLPTSSEGHKFTTNVIEELRKACEATGAGAKLENLENLIRELQSRNGIHRAKVNKPGARAPPSLSTAPELRRQRLSPNRESKTDQLIGIKDASNETPNKPRRNPRRVVDNRMENEQSSRMNNAPRDRESGYKTPPQIQETGYDTETTDEACKSEDTDPSSGSDENEIEPKPELDIDDTAPLTAPQTSIINNSVPMIAETPDGKSPQKVSGSNRDVGTAGPRTGVNDGTLSVEMDMTDAPGGSENAPLPGGVPDVAKSWRQLVTQRLQIPDGQSKKRKREESQPQIVAKSMEAQKYEQLSESIRKHLRIPASSAEPETEKSKLLERIAKDVYNLRPTGYYMAVLLLVRQNEKYYKQLPQSAVEIVDPGRAFLKTHESSFGSCTHPDFSCQEERCFRQWYYLCPQDREQEKKDIDMSFDEFVQQRRADFETLFKQRRDRQWKFRRDDYLAKYSTKYFNKYLKLQLAEKIIKPFNLYIIKHHNLEHSLMTTGCRNALTGCSTHSAQSKLEGLLGGPEKQMEKKQNKEATGKSTRYTKNSAALRRHQLDKRLQTLQDNKRLRTKVLALQHKVREQREDDINQQGQNKVKQSDESDGEKDAARQLAQEEQAKELKDLVHCHNRLSSFILKDIEMRFKWIEEQDETLQEKFDKLTALQAQADKTTDGTVQNAMTIYRLCNELHKSERLPTFQNIIERLEKDHACLEHKYESARKGVVRVAQEFTQSLQGDLTVFTELTPSPPAASLSGEQISGHMRSIFRKEYYELLGEVGTTSTDPSKVYDAIFTLIGRAWEKTQDGQAEVVRQKAEMETAEKIHLKRLQQAENSNNETQHQVQLLQESLDVDHTKWREAADQAQFVLGECEESELLDPNANKDTSRKTGKEKRGLGAANLVAWVHGEKCGCGKFILTYQPDKPFKASDYTTCEKAFKDVISTKSVQGSAQSRTAYLALLRVQSVMAKRGDTIKQLRGDLSKAHARHLEEESAEKLELSSLKNEKSEAVDAKVALHNELNRTVNLVGSALQYVLTNEWPIEEIKLKACINHGVVDVKEMEHLHTLLCDCSKVSFLHLDQTNFNPDNYTACKPPFRALFAKNVKIKFEEQNGTLGGLLSTLVEVRSKLNDTKRKLKDAEEAHIVKSEDVRLHREAWYDFGKSTVEQLSQSLKGQGKIHSAVVKDHVSKLPSWLERSAKTKYGEGQDQSTQIPIEIYSEPGSTADPRELPTLLAEVKSVVTAKRDLESALKSTNQELRAAEKERELILESWKRCYPHPRECSWTIETIALRLASSTSANVACQASLETPQVKPVVKLESKSVAKDFELQELQDKTQTKLSRETASWLEGANLLQTVLAYHMRQAESTRIREPERRDRSTDCKEEEDQRRQSIAQMKTCLVNGKLADMKLLKQLHTMMCRCNKINFPEDADKWTSEAHQYCEEEFAQVLPVSACNESPQSTFCCSVLSEIECFVKDRSTKILQLSDELSEKEKYIDTRKATDSTTIETLQAQIAGLTEQHGTLLQKNKRIEKENKSAVHFLKLVLRCTVQEEPPDSSLRFTTPIEDGEWANSVVINCLHTILCGCEDFDKSKVKQSTFNKGNYTTCKKRFQNSLPDRIKDAVKDEYKACEEILTTMAEARFVKADLSKAQADLSKAQADLSKAQAEFELAKKATETKSKSLEQRHRTALLNFARSITEHLADQLKGQMNEDRESSLQDVITWLKASLETDYGDRKDDASVPLVIFKKLQSTADFETLPQLFAQVRGLVTSKQHADDTQVAKPSQAQKSFTKQVDLIERAAYSEETKIHQEQQYITFVVDLLRSLSVAPDDVNKVQYTLSRLFHDPPSAETRQQLESLAMRLTVRLRTLERRRVSTLKFFIREMTENEAINSGVKGGFGSERMKEYLKLNWKANDCDADIDYQQEKDEFIDRETAKTYFDVMEALSTRQQQLMQCLQLLKELWEIFQVQLKLGIWSALSHGERIQGLGLVLQRIKEDSRQPPVAEAEKTIGKLRKTLEECGNELESINRQCAEAYAKPPAYIQPLKYPGVASAEAIRITRDNIIYKTNDLFSSKEKHRVWTTFLIFRAKVKGKTPLVDRIEKSARLGGIYSKSLINCLSNEGIDIASKENIPEQGPYWETAGTLIEEILSVKGHSSKPIKKRALQKQQNLNTDLEQRYLEIENIKYNVVGIEPYDHRYMLQLRCKDGSNHQEKWMSLTKIFDAEQNADVCNRNAEYIFNLCKRALNDPEAYPGFRFRKGIQTTMHLPSCLRFETVLGEGKSGCYNVSYRDGTTKQNVVAKEIFGMGPHAKADLLAFLKSKDNKPLRKQFAEHSKNMTPKDTMFTPGNAKDINPSKNLAPLKLAAHPDRPIRFAPAGTNIAEHAKATVAKDTPHLQNQNRDEILEEVCSDEVIQQRVQDSLEYDLKRQGAIDPVKIFGRPGPFEITKVFDQTKSKRGNLDKRTSSGNWSGFKP